MNNGFLGLSIIETHKLLKAREISVEELIIAYLERSKEINKKTSSFITISENQARKQARQADKIFKQKKAHILCGIPFSMKDSYVTKGIQTTAGSRVLENYIPQYDATVYKKLNNLGAVLIGKNSQDAWGHGGSSENTDFGPVRNPWDLSRTAGGSGGGTAAAIASDAVIFGIGEDTGGSIRNPAAFCNITGLKVSYGRVSRYGTIAYASSLDTVGSTAKSVEDCAIVLKAIAGYDPLDASSSRLKVPDYANRKKTSLKGKRLGIIKEHFKSGLDSEVEDKLRKAIKEFENLGMIVSEIEIPAEKHGHAIYHILAFSETSSNLARYDAIRYGNVRESFTKETKRRILTGTYGLSTGYYEAYYKKAQQARTTLRNQFKKAFQQVDVIVAPVMPFPAYKLGEIPHKKKSYSVAMYLADSYTSTTNTVGIPSLALPAGFSKQGLPIGMQILGPMNSEEKLLNIGQQYQGLTNWHTKKPSI